MIQELPEKPSDDSNNNSELSLTSQFAFFDFCRQLDDCRDINKIRSLAKDVYKYHLGFKETTMKLLMDK